MINIIKGKKREGALPERFNKENYSKVKAFHESLPEFSVTPLVRLEDTAKLCGVKDIYIKDESKRYGLNAFKALGAAYAMGNLVAGLEEGKDALFVTATDGNHGRAVAWAATRAGYKSVVFMPQGTVPARVENIHKVADAEVIVTECNYDDTVRMAMKYAEENNGFLVQDTGFDGYEDIPWDITLGYTKMIAEAIEQLDGVVPTHVFLQAGVGSMAGGVLGYLKDTFGDKCPVVTILEAEESACIFESAKADEYVAIGGSPKTIMAGLNCGETNRLVFRVLMDHADFYIKTTDDTTIDGMRQLAKEGVVAGECGGIGTGIMMNLDDEMKRVLGIDENSVILLFSTEGDTDPEMYKKIISGDY